MSTVLEMIIRRDFDGKDVRATLDELSLSEVIMNIGSPITVKKYRRPMRVRDYRPTLHTEDPAVAEAMGRCAMARAEAFLQTAPAMHAETSAIHRTADCLWCEWPTDFLIDACDEAVITMRYLEDEFMVWYEDSDRRRGSRYIRYVRGAVYENDGWATFWSLPTHEREARVSAAMYGVR
jgi:hypothetical protein